MGKYYDKNGTRQEADTSGVYCIEIGCDVARFGDDKTCIGYRINEAVFIYKKYNGQDTVWTTSNVVALYKQLRERFSYKGIIPIKIDDGGVGGGVVDQLRHFKKDNKNEADTLLILPINFGQSIKHKYYTDTTTYMMGVIRDMVHPIDSNGNVIKPQIILPNDNDLIAQLSCRKYRFESNTKQKVESKKEMKERGLSSPDEADCILLVCLPVNLKKGGKGSAR